MKKITVAICDDEDVMLLATDSLVREIFTAEGVECTTECFDSTERLAKAYKKMNYDLILLDIEMPGTDGISFGKALRKYEDEKGCGHRADIIYISNHDEKVFDSFMAKPFAFIRKSRIMSEGKKVLKLYADSMASENDVVEFSSGAEHYRLSAGEIVYVESILHNQIIHIIGSSDRLKIRSTMASVEACLTPHGFIKVHTSYLVNWKYIKRISPTDVCLTSGDTVPLSRNRKNAVMGEYLRLSREEGISKL